jgi:hypothetical protein
VRAAASRLLGPGFAPVAAIAVEIELEEHAGGFTLHVEIEGEGLEGERTLHMPSCAEVRDAAALVIAVSIDPELTHSSEETEPEALEAEPKSTTDGNEPPALELAASFGIDGMLLPGAAPLLGAQLGLHVAPLRFALGGVLLLPSAVTVDSPTRGFEVDMGAAAVRASACLTVVTFEPASLAPCAGVWLGRIWAELEDSSVARGELLVAPELSLSGDYQLSRSFVLGLRLGALLPLQPPRFSLRDGQGLHETPRFSAQAEVVLRAGFRLGG